MALANPNNPTGTQVPKADLKAILLAATDTVVLVDEAYQDFSGQTILPWIRKYPNLIVTRTFSKAFGLAALRMGCLFANPQLIEPLQRGQNPFAVNSLALLCTCIAIRCDAQVRKYAETIRTNRKAFCRWLDAQGIPYVPSQANFVLTRVGEHASGNRPETTRQENPGTRLELRSTFEGLSAIHHWVRGTNAPSVGRIGSRAEFDRDA